MGVVEMVTKNWTLGGGKNGSGDKELDLGDKGKGSGGNGDLGDGENGSSGNGDEELDLGGGNNGSGDEELDLGDKGKGSGGNGDLGDGENGSRNGDEELDLGDKGKGSGDEELDLRGGENVKVCPWCGVGLLFSYLFFTRSAASYKITLLFGFGGSR